MFFYFICWLVIYNLTVNIVSVKEKKHFVEDWCEGKRSHFVQHPYKCNSYVHCNHTVRPEYIYGVPSGCASDRCFNLNIDVCKGCNYCGTTGKKCVVCLYKTFLFKTSVCISSAQSLRKDGLLKTNIFFFYFLFRNTYK